MTKEFEAGITALTDIARVLRDFVPHQGILKTRIREIDPEVTETDDQQAAVYSREISRTNVLRPQGKASSLTDIGPHDTTVNPHVALTSQ